MTVPPGWRVHEYAGPWTALEEFGVGAEVPGEDAITSPDFESFLVMNSMAIPAGVTEARWLADFDALVQAALPASCPGTKAQGELGGAPATVLSVECAGARTVGWSLTHGGRGYYFTTKAPVSDAANLAIIEHLAASIEFVD